MVEGLSSNHQLGESGTARACGGLEPHASAVTGPERCTYDLRELDLDELRSRFYVIPQSGLFEGETTPAACAESRAQAREGVPSSSVRTAPMPMSFFSFS